MVDDAEELGEVVLLAAPWLVEQLEDTMLALDTLKVPSLLGVPVTATVCPTWSLKAALLFDCNCHALPLLSVRV